MRTPPIPAPNTIEIKSNDIITEVRTYSVITPLFGGGVEPGKADPITTVRASEVRGQLRFWWRATRGGQFDGDLGKMREAEEALWGGPAREEDGKTVGGQSRVGIVVEQKGSAKEDAPFEGAQKGGNWKAQPRQQSAAPAYAAFPLQPTDNELRSWNASKKTKTVLVDTVFTLTISFPEANRFDVEASLWAWETFGGIGGRTRRGFGALRLDMINGKKYTNISPAQCQRASQWIKERIEYFIRPNEQKWPKNVPHLSRNLRNKIVQRANANTKGEWHDLIKSLKRFRQSRRNKETLRADDFGHSDWPESNAIRGFFMRSARGPHSNRHIHKFPRAQLGLPIVFHLAHDANIPDVTLQGQDQDKLRLASPLILKPLACADDKALGLACILEGVNLPERLMLTNVPRNTDGTEHVVETSLSRGEAEQIPPLDGSVNVLQAFLDTL